MARWYGLMAAALAPFLGGCVDRRFVVTTNVPGAQVFWEGKPLGPSPVDSRWEYAGNYNFSALAPGYEPLSQTVRLAPKWYMYPPFDLITETLYPGRIEDVRRITLTLRPSPPLSDAELIGNAERIRAEGKALPPSRILDKKDPAPRAAGAPAAPPPSTTPGPTDPVVPSVGPGLPYGGGFLPPDRLDR